MEPLGLTGYRVAKEIGVSAPRVNDIVLGKRAISADTALRLGVFFGLPAQFWLNLQNDYDLRRAGTEALAKIRPYRAAYESLPCSPRGQVEHDLEGLFTTGLGEFVALEPAVDHALGEAHTPHVQDGFGAGEGSPP